MAEQAGNGLTLEGLAQRLEALEQQAEEAQRPEAPERREPSMVGQEMTLEGLAQRLGALESENALLRQELEALRASLGIGRRGEPASEFDGPARRRSLLRGVGAAVLGVARNTRGYTYFDQVICNFLRAENYLVAGGVGVYGGQVFAEESTSGGFGVWGRNTAPTSSSVPYRTGGV